MNTINSYIITSPKDKMEECAKFVIDDLAQRYVLRSIMQIGEIYTFGFWAKSETPGEIKVQGKSFEITNEWAFFSVTFVADSANLAIKFALAGTYYVYHSQLESGNKATDWTPAPEDFEVAIDEAAKTATNFLEYDTENGLQVGDKVNGEWSGTRARMTADSFNILSTAGKVLASYGAKLVELGMDSEEAIIRLCGGLASMNADENGNFLISADDICVKSPANKYDKSGSYSRLTSNSHSNLTVGDYTNAEVSCYSRRDTENDVRSAILSLIAETSLVNGRASIELEANQNGTTLEMSAGAIGIKTTGLGNVGIEGVGINLKTRGMAIGLGNTAGDVSLKSTTGDLNITASTGNVRINGFGFYTDPTVVYLATSNTPYTNAEGKYILADSADGEALLADAATYTTGTITGDFRTVGGADSVLKKFADPVYKIAVTDAVSSNAGKTVEYDIRPYYSRYTDITIDNIVVQLPCIRQVANLTTERLLNVTYSYEPTTGILTISSTSKIWSVGGTQTFDIFIIGGQEAEQLKDYLGLKGVIGTKTASSVTSYTYTFEQDFDKCLIFVASARTGTAAKVTPTYTGEGTVETLVSHSQTASATIANRVGTLILSCENVKSGETINFAIASSGCMTITTLETE